MENKWPKNKWLKAGIVLSAVGSVMILLILVIGLALSGIALMMEIIVHRS